MQRALAQPCLHPPRLSAPSTPTALGASCALRRR